MNDELLGELLQGFNDDLVDIRKRLAQQPAPLDYRPDLERITTKVVEMQTLLKQATSVSPPPVKMSKEFEQQLQQLVGQEVRRHHPDRPVTEAVKYGIWVFIVVLVLLPVSFWGWWNAAAERDRYERSAWLWRHTTQLSSGYTASLTAQWRQDSIKFQERTIGMEEHERLLVQAQRKRAEAMALEKQATSKKAKR